MILCHTGIQYSCCCPNNINKCKKTGKKSGATNKYHLDSHIVLYKTNSIRLSLNQIMVLIKSEMEWV